MVLTGGPHPRKESLAKAFRNSGVWGWDFLIAGATLGHLILFFSAGKDLMESAPPHTLHIPHICPLSRPCYFLASFILSAQDSCSLDVPLPKSSLRPLILLHGRSVLLQRSITLKAKGTNPSPLSLSDGPAWKEITPLVMMINFMCQPG